jgi:two-component system CheB/CheR fusion protein
VQHPTHIVAIGASAGGLEALRQFFSVKLEGTSLAFVVIQHISPTYKSLMPELMAKVTDIPVVTIEEEQEIEAGYIYLIPRGFKVRLDGWKFVTEPTDPLRRVLNLPINIFFKSAADTHKELVVGVILSGTGSDGALGLQRIHEVGGLTLVQAPETAQFDGMPRAALDVLRADFMLHPKEMIPEIVRYSQGLPVQSAAGDELSSASEDDETLTQIFRILGNRVGIDYSKYKLPTLARRIEKRMKLRHLQSLVEYADLLTVNSDECHELAKDFLINVTQFFRDSEFFDVLYMRAILPIVRNASPNEVIRIWVPACATGEEAYTLAMLMMEADAELQTRVKFKIFATDLDAESIQVASRGVYPESVVATLPEKFLNKYFTKREATYVIDPSVRERILFAPQDLIHSPPFRKLHLVSCRNVLIYFQHELQMEILRKFHYSLVPGGFLFLGSSESVSDAREEFEVIYSKGKIFKKIGSSHSRLNWSPSLKAELQLPLQSALVQNLASPLGHATINVKTVHFGASLMEAMLSPGVVINSKNMIVHFVGDVSRFFAHPVGEASFEALRLIRPQFKAALRSATFKMFSPDSQSDVRFEVRESSGDPGVLVVGRRFIEPNTQEPLAFVRFQDVETEASAVTVFAADSESNSVILELEHELERTRDRLQNSIEALEITNEELHSTNEELLSANEELQSTNEELQSVNEELHTVNSEHQMKIEELIELNSDLDNLLAHTDIGVLFLDEKLNVRKYTQAAKKYIHIMERDVGRSIRHLAIRISFPSFVSELEKVLSQGSTTESKIYSSASDVVLVRIVPYQRSAGLAAGVTVIFINVDYQSEVVERLNGAHVETICRLFHMLPMPAFVINDSGVYIDANEKMLGIAQVPLIGFDDRSWLDEFTCGKLRLQESAALHSKSGVSEVITLAHNGVADDFRRILFPLPQAETQSPRLLVGVLLSASEPIGELEFEGFEHLKAVLTKSGSEARPTN